MKRTSALVEFALTTAMLAFWAVACAAAFQATTSTPANDSAGSPETVSVAASQQAPAAQPVTIEASLDVAPRAAVVADRI